MRVKHRLILVLIVFIGLMLNAQTTPKPKKAALPPVDEAKLSKLSVTRHSIMVDGKPLHYTATTGYMLMKDETGKLQASIFFIAYNKEGKYKPGERPITFSFNGGPGSSSIWLHMGALGPKRVKMSAEGFQLAQPYRAVDNPDTWLSFSDLVFIDPVSTGYSRPAPGVKKSKFHGLREDIQSVADFIRLYITRYKRWLSPKFLCGESYGTTRAAGLSEYLHENLGINMQGIVLVSAIMNFQTARFVAGNDLPYPLFLPTYTATAWYHKKLPQKYLGDLRATLKEVEQWALTDYHVALAKGDRLTPKERQTVISRLADYTGLKEKVIDQYDLRIPIYSFVDELMQDEKQLAGRLDSRFKRFSDTPFRTGLVGDPSYIAIEAPYSAVINHYFREDLKYTNDLHYWAISPNTYPWNFGRGNNFVNVSEDLKRAMIKNKYLKIMIANGYYDLATPYFATDYTIHHMGVPPELAENITMKYYESGHMMYIREASLKKFTNDVREFFKSTRAD